MATEPSVEIEFEEPDPWMSRERVQTLVLLAATGIVLYLCYRLLQPFLPSLSWALALAIVAYPMHRWIAGKVGRPNIAATLSVILVSILLIAPAIFVVYQISRETATQAKQVEEKAKNGQWREAMQRYPRLQQPLEWAEANIDVRATAANAVNAVTGDVGKIVMGSAAAAAQLLITLLILFYLFRDRVPAVKLMRSLLPMSDAEASMLFHRVADTVFATVYGRVMTAMVQGALGGIMFFFLKLPAPILWGVVMGLLSIVPVLGSFVIWIPAAIYLAVEGRIGAAGILTVWGTVVIGLIDNLIGPILVGDRLKMHPLPVFFAILGGLAAFGGAGLILGPVILALADGLLDIWRRRTAGHQPIDQPIEDPKELKEAATK